MELGHVKKHGLECAATSQGLSEILHKLGKGKEKNASLEL